MAFNTRNLKRIREAIRLHKANSYPEATEVKLTMDNAGPAVLLNLSINIDIAKITRAMESFHYSTVGIENAVRLIMPDANIKCDTLSIGVYPDRVYLNGFIWIR